MDRKAIALGAFAILSVACGSSGGNSATGRGGTGGSSGLTGAGGGRDAGGETRPVADAAVDLAGDALVGDASAPGSPTQVRLAHLSPDLSPVDFCLSPHGTAAFQGPLLGLRANPDGGGGGGVTFGQVGAYLPIDPGTYDLRLVPAGSASCLAMAGDGGGAAPIGVPDATNLPAFEAGVSVTLLVAGDLAPTGSDAPLAIRAIPDDTALPFGQVLLRVVNAVPSLPAADFGLGSFAGGWFALFTDVPFGEVGMTPGMGVGTPDSQGYLFVATLAGQTMSVRATSGATADTAVAPSVEIDLGSLATLFAVGGKTGDAAHPPGLLLCVDNQPSGGLLSDCSPAP